MKLQTVKGMNDYLPKDAELRDYLELNEDSQVLCFSTEGDTDPERYKNIVWYGLDK